MYMWLLLYIGDGLWSVVTLASHHAYAPNSRTYIHICILFFISGPNPVTLDYRLYIELENGSLGTNFLGKALKNHS
jgi:hypothetical protein